MKNVIAAYVTALINSHERTINRLYGIKVNNVEIKKYENFKNELCDLLDFVMDIKEEKEPITVVLSSNKEVEALKKRIRELEETCEANNEVIENQFKKIQRLESEKMEEI